MPDKDVSKALASLAKVVWTCKTEKGVEFHEKDVSPGVKGLQQCLDLSEIPDFLMGQGLRQDGYILVNFVSHRQYMLAPK